MGIGSAQVDVRLSHKGDLKDDIEWVAKVVAKMNGARDATIETFNILADTRVTSEEVKRVIEAAYPEPRKPGKVQLAEMAGDGIALGSLSHKASLALQVWENQKEDVQRKREDTAFRYQRINDEFGEIAETRLGSVERRGRK